MATEHTDIPEDGIHILHRWKVADDAELAALVPVAEDIDKVALVADTGAYHRLVSTTPSLVWEKFSMTSTQEVQLESIEYDRLHQLFDITDVADQAAKDALTPATDDIVYVEDSKTYEEFDGSSWVAKTDWVISTPTDSSGPILDNTTAIANPTNLDGSDSGYEVGSRWFNGSVVFICVDSTVGAAIWNEIPPVVVPLKHNLTATVNPTTSDDSGSGYSTNSLWVNTTDDYNVYLCIDDTAGSAIWRLLTHKDTKFNESFTATGGETDITIPNSKIYTVGGADLLVFREGIAQSPTTDYTETDSTSVTFAQALSDSEHIMFQRV